MGVNKAATVEDSMDAGTAKCVRLETDYFSFHLQDSWFHTIEYFQN